MYITYIYHIYIIYISCTYITYIYVSRKLVKTLHYLIFIIFYRRYFRGGGMTRPPTYGPGTRRDNPSPLSLQSPTLIHLSFCTTRRQTSRRSVCGPSPYPPHLHPHPHPINLLSDPGFCSEPSSHPVSTGVERNVSQSQRKSSLRLLSGCRRRLYLSRRGFRLVGSLKVGEGRGILTGGLGDGGSSRYSTWSSTSGTRPATNPSTSGSGTCGTWTGRQRRTPRCRWRPGRSGRREFCC